MRAKAKQRKPHDMIPFQTLRRIPHYHQILTELEQKGEQYVSSRYLAHFFQVDDVSRPVWIPES